MPTLFRLAFVCCVSLLPSASSSATVPGVASRRDDWPMPRHDARGTGLSAERIQPRLKLSWRVRGLPAMRPDLLASGGAISVNRQPESVADKPEVLLFRAANGTLIRRFPRATACYLKGSRIVLVQDAEAGSAFEAWDWQKNTKLWSLPVRGMLEYLRGAVESGGKLFCAFSYRPPKVPKEGGSGWGFETAALRSVDLASGKELAAWDGGIQEWGVGPPATDGTTVYHGASHWLRAFDAETLKSKWGIFEGGNAFPILLEGPRTLLVKGWLHYLSAIDLNTKKGLWAVGCPRDLPHSLVQGKTDRPEDRLVVETSTAVDPRTGDILSRLSVGGTEVYARSTAGSGKLAFMAGSRGEFGKTGGFYAFEAATGRLRLKYERAGLRGTGIVISEGAVYGAGSDGYLYRFK